MLSCQHMHDSIDTMHGARCDVEVQDLRLALYDWRSPWTSHAWIALVEIQQSGGVLKDRSWRCRLVDTHEFVLQGFLFGIIQCNDCTSVCTGVCLSNCFWAALVLLSHKCSGSLCVLIETSELSHPWRTDPEVSPPEAATYCTGAIASSFLILHPGELLFEKRPFCSTASFTETIAES